MGTGSPDDEVTTGPENASRASVVPRPKAPLSVHSCSSSRSGRAYHPQGRSEAEEARSALTRSGAEATAGALCRTKPPTCDSAEPEKLERHVSLEPTAWTR